MTTQTKIQKLVIALGTTSPQKIGYLKEVLKDLKIKPIIKSVKARSEVSDQPITSKETKTGSIKRAKNALKEIKDADFALGIEVGYHSFYGQYYSLSQAFYNKRPGRSFNWIFLKR